MNILLVNAHMFGAGLYFIVKLTLMDKCFIEIAALLNKTLVTKTSVTLLIIFLIKKGRKKIFFYIYLPWRTVS